MPDHQQSPREVYDAFRTSLLEHTDTWKDFLVEEVTVKSPMVSLAGKAKFIKLYEAFYKNVTSSVIHKLVEHQDFVITQISTTSIMPNEEPIVLHMNQWYTIRGGKIEAISIYFDAAGLSYRYFG